ncbi:Cilia- and flagella-associated protein 57 [Kappamyces sp. JEL0829]|nr:Cilia- and flagella-associated protein 57 [Kappamyces sp. JEL0829]
MSSIAGVEYRHVFGLKAETHGNIGFLDEQTLIYPAGSNLVFYNQESKLQRFIHISEKAEGIVAMNVSMNRRWVAISEQSKKPTCVIHDLSTFRKRKVLNLPDAESRDFVSMSFSGDAKFMVTQTSGPDWMLHFWSWEKAKVLASVRAANAAEKGIILAGAAQTKDGKDPLVGQVIYQCLINPADSSQVSVVGNGIFKVFRFSEGVLKQLAGPKLDQKNILTHCWTADEKIVCGTEDGKVLVFESSGELKHEFTHVQTASQAVRSVNVILSFARGLLLGSAGGTVALYEKGDDLQTTAAGVNPGQVAAGARDAYRKTREFNLTEDVSGITKLAISPTEEFFLCATEKSQMYSGALSSGEVKVTTQNSWQGDDYKLEQYAQPFHHGQITGMDTCVRKPLVVTCSADKSIRVWNYNEETSELVKYFPEESYSVAIHPSGLYILVGFSDKLRLMNLLIDDIRPFREFTVRGCKECRFSNGGQYFAAVTANTVQIFSTWNFELLGSLKGHNGKVKSIHWTSDDSKIVTSGTEGAIYEWSLKDMSGHAGQGIRRETESILKTCSYSCAYIHNDGKTVYAVGSDHTLKEIVEGQITRELEAEVVLTQVTMSPSGKMMFVGTNTGAVRAMKFPFAADAGVFQEHFAHSGPITRLRVSYDDQYLFSVGDDGCFYIFKIFDKDNRSFKREREMVYADEILVTKSDLEEKNAMMGELKTRVEELKMENEYQLRLKDMNFNEKIKQVTEKFMQEIETLKITSTVLRTDKEKEELRHEEEMQEEKERHSKDLLEMENSQNVKLMAEYDKYQDLQQKTAELQDQWDHQMRDMQNAKNKALDDLNQHFEARLMEKQQEMDQLQEEIKKQLLEYEETTRETEQDADTEIIELRHRYEKKLKDEREIVLRLKGENGIMRKKFNTLQGEIDTHKGEISKMYNEEKKLHSVIKSLEKDIAGLKKEIHERDETIQDKEKRIYDLKKKNQELEKFKFVLDYKIKELKKQIEPRENDIQAMSSQIKDMNVELENYHKSTSELELSIGDLKLKLKAAEKEVVKERQQVTQGIALIKGFKIDLQHMVQHIQEPKLLKSGLKKIYHKYCKDMRYEDSTDSDPQAEYSRQREYLERTITSLRKKALKDQYLHRADNVKIIQENVLLINEINHLRKDLGVMSKKEKSAEAMLKLNKGAPSLDQTEQSQASLPDDRRTSSAGSKSILN